jgi:hypothetical protein
MNMTPRIEDPAMRGRAGLQYRVKKSISNSDLEILGLVGAPREAENTIKRTVII